MCAFRVTVSRRRRQELEHQLHTAQQFGKLHAVKCLLAILALTDGQAVMQSRGPCASRPRPCTSGCAGGCSMA